MEKNFKIGDKVIIDCEKISDYYNNDLEKRNNLANRHSGKIYKIRYFTNSATFPGEFSARLIIDNSDKTFNCRFLNKALIKINIKINYKFLND